MSSVSTASHEARAPFDTVAARPRWSLARQLQLPGCVRGALLRDWAALVQRRWGADAAERARDALGVSSAALPDSPDAEAWFPVGYQLALTAHLVDTYLDGDMLALEPMLLEDALRNVDRVSRWVARRLPPKRVFGAASKAYPHGYDTGAASVVVTRHDTTISWRGATHCGSPTWRALQLFAMRATMETLGRPALDAWAEDAGDTAFRAGLRWK